MTVYVDDLKTYPRAAVKGWAKRCGVRWCHLWADTEDELHAFAKSIGMRRSWYQYDAVPWRRHYDLTPTRRERAVALGAVEVKAREYVARRMREAGVLK